MGYDEIRESLDGINKKLDDLTLEISGDKDHPGIRARLATVEMYFSFIKWAVGAVILLALGSAWAAFTGLFGKGK